METEKSYTYFMGKLKILIRNLAQRACKTLFGKSGSRSLTNNHYCYHESSNKNRWLIWKNQEGKITEG